jgi:hypothetical protein
MRSSLRLSGLLGVAAASACTALVDVDPTLLEPTKTGAPEPIGRDCERCDDGIPCTVDECTPQGCVHRPEAARCDDGVSCTEDICDATRGCQHIERNERCEFCAPGSVCRADVGGCVGARVLRDCDDGDPCTRDYCDVARASCVSEPMDADGDGFPAAEVMGRACGGTDCDDHDPNVYPGAQEICDGIDNSCNGRVDDACAAIPDDCRSAATVTLSPDGRATVEGTFEGLSNDADVRCGVHGTPDAIYRIPVQGVVDVTFDSEGSQEAIVLAAAPGCDAAFEFACAGVMRTGSSRLSLHRYDASAHGPELFLLVDAKAPGARGRYRVNVRVKPAVDDRCGPSVFDFTGCGTLVGFMEEQFGGGRMSGSCQRSLLGGVAPEAVVRLRAGLEATRLDVTASSVAFPPTLYARSQCVGSSAELACATQDAFATRGEAKIALDLRAGQEVFLVVDDGVSGGRYTLTCEP